MPGGRFQDRIAEGLARLGPAEQRVVRYFEANPEEVLIASAAALAVKAGTSDATVVRATKALGFRGLPELRRAIADELRQTLSPAERLTRTLSEVEGSISGAFRLTLDIHLRCLESLRSAIAPELFERAVDAVVSAKRIVAFGLGPSGAIAGYFATQLGRFGMDTLCLANTGLLFADDLQKLQPGDLIFMLAYGRLYPELSALVDEIGRLALRSMLVTDTLAASLRNRVDLVLPVPRGRAEMISMHTATLAFIEALLVGVAASRPEETVAALQRLDRARQQMAGKHAGLNIRRQAR